MVWGPSAIGVTLDQWLREYGIYWVKYVMSLGYTPLLKALAPNFRGFVENIDTIHTLLSECYDHLVAPMFRYMHGIDVQNIPRPEVEARV